MVENLAWFFHHFGLFALLVAFEGFRHGEVVESQTGVAENED